jgi:hypothetical protein
MNNNVVAIKNAVGFGFWEAETAGIMEPLNGIVCGEFLVALECDFVWPHKLA